ncbi:MAG: S8 family serine peptidase, partial [Mariprofundaceae bacterium]
MVHNMKGVLFFVSLAGLIFCHQAWAQDLVVAETNQLQLQQLSQVYKQQHALDRAKAIQKAQQLGLPIRYEQTDGALLELQGMAPNGMPMYYKTENLNAAKTVSTNQVWPGGLPGLSLTGNGMTVGEWDGGAVLSTHQEFAGRVTQMDAATATHYHATHVAGTMIASGVQAAAKGMAYQASLNAYDWNSDSAEMATAAAAGLLLSNHSYGSITGWHWDGSAWYWYGDTGISQTEDYGFGFYSSGAQAWDQIAVNAPYYLIVKSAGNDRNNTGPGPGGSHFVWSGFGWALSTVTRPADGAPLGYDSISYSGTAKNILTVGAVNDVPTGYSVPGDVVMSSFSGWGPVDDGRIKPDIVANGVGLYSPFDTSNTAYGSISGTSMSSPSMTGSLLLLQQHYKNTHATNPMRSATLKALAIHTADEAGPANGPDYQFGWGLLNTQSAANIISSDGSGSIISELTLASGGTTSIPLIASGADPLRVTIVWTDPAGTPPPPSLDPPTKMLVNDLDLRISDGVTTYFPWVLDRLNPATAATTGDNNTDNVEQIVIPAPINGGTYTLTINHKGTLQGGLQNYSLIASGIAVPTFTIGGTVTLNATPLSGVSFSGTGGAICNPSNASGNYTCTVSQGWSGRIAPALAAYTFTPASISYTNVTADQMLQDYTAADSSDVVWLEEIIPAGALTGGAGEGWNWVTT